MISKSPEDVQYYEDRLKFLRDERGKLEAARQEGRQEGHQEGRQEGRQEGKLAGKIQALQELLEIPISTDDQLMSQSIDVLAKQVQLLQERLRKNKA